MANSPTLGFSYFGATQQDADVKVNDLINRLESLLRGVKDRDLATPPGSPSNGDAYIVAASGTGAWSGEDGNIAMYYDGWLFIAPKEGIKLWVDDEDRVVHYNGSAWIPEQPLYGVIHTSTINMQTAGAQNLYTVPTGYKLYMTAIVLREPSATAFGTSIQIGSSGTSATSFVGTRDLSNLGSTDHVAVITPSYNASIVPVQRVYAAADVIQANAPSQSIGTVNVTVDIIGYLIKT